MRARMKLYVIVAGILVLSLIVPRVRNVMAQSIETSVPPSSYTTQKGATGNQPVDALAVMDQSGTMDTASAYVAFTTPGTVYAGTQTFQMPAGVTGASIASMKIVVNYKGPKAINQKWTWYLFNPATRLWAAVGTNAAVTSNSTWTRLEFPVTKPANFVSATGEVLISLRSSNSTGDALLDYEAIVFTAGTSPTPTVIPPTATPSPTFTPTPLPSPTSTPAPAVRTFYVSPSGADTNSGLTEAQAWKTLSKVNGYTFQAGDVIRFQRGGTWSGGLIIKNSGQSGKPIVVTSYGSGSLPVISNPGGAGNYTSAIKVVGQWVVVDGLKVYDAQDAGVYVQASNVVVQNVEATNVGIGVKLNGHYNLVTRNYIHDLHMVRNTVGGVDDYGAIGVSLNNSSNNEISYNTIINCKAPSYDFGFDGGIVEFYGVTDGNYIHHNWGADSNGFIEVGGGSAVNDIIAYNVSVNNGHLTSIHLNDAWASTVSNFRVENNTVVESQQGAWMLIKFVGDPTTTTYLLRNNVFHISGYQGISNKSTITHTNNIYQLGSGTSLGFSLGSGEKLADPLFVNYAGRDFRLQAVSPAINAGLTLGYLLDYISAPVPSGNAPDLGAYEHQAP